MRSTIRENGDHDEFPLEEPPYQPTDEDMAWPEPQPKRAYEKTPPNGESEEKIVLGAMMMSVDAIGDITDIVKSDDFYRPKHATVFDAIVKLYGDGEPTDAVAVSAQLLSTNDLIRIGGVPYLHDCLSAVPTAANGTYYARKVVDLAARRRLLNAGMKISQLASDPTRPVDSVINDAEAAIFNAVQARENGDLVPAAKIVGPTLQAIRDAAARGGGMRGITTGYADLDRLTSGLRPGQLMVVAGRPGMGKSICAVDTARANAIRDGRPVAIFSLEMSEEEIMTRILAAESRVRLTQLTEGTAGQGDWGYIDEAAAKIEQAPLHIDDTPGLTMTEIRSRARRMKQRLGLELVVVDYLQLMTPAGRRGDNRQQEVADISRGLKLLAKEIEVPVIAVAQLNRGVEQRSDKRPMLSDLRESGALEQDADLVLFVHRDDYYDKETPRAGEADLILAKHRGGPTDTVTVVAQLHLARFADMRVV